MPSLQQVSAAYACSPCMLLSKVYHYCNGIRLIKSLQGLRGIAALAVLLFHLVPYFRISGTVLFPDWIFRWGFSGVDLFFVLSGFVLSISYASGSSTSNQLPMFFSRRFLRIYAGYWPFLVIAYVIGTIWNIPRTENDSLLHSIFLTSTDLSILVLPISWSLSHELYFYGIFGLAFLVSGTTFRVLAVLYAIAIVAANLMSDMTGPASGFLLSHFTLEFLLGGLLAAAYRRRMPASTHIIAAVLCILFLILGAQLNADRGLVRSATFGVGAALLLWAFLGTERSWSSKKLKWLVLLGDASFTLYLCHITFIDIFYLTGICSFLGKQHPLVADLGNLAFIAVVVLFSVGFYLRVERPVYLWITNRERPWIFS